ncbi:MAG: GntR family transcriptional regulator [Micromonosporaceae bacterium]
MTSARAARPDAAPVRPGSRSPLSKTAYVLERLREEIASGIVVPGSSLRQAEIAERYGVSATPVREALRLLEAEGAISYAPHRGATVRELSPTRTQDVYLLRAEIEGLATQVAVERMKDSDLERIQEMHAELKRESKRRDGETLAVMNRRLHFAIYEAGSETIATHAASLWRLFPPHVTIWSSADAARALIKDHEDILEAIANRDPKLARERAAEHIFHAAELRKRL